MESILKIMEEKIMGLFSKLFKGPEIDMEKSYTSLQVQKAPKVINRFIVHSPVEFAVFLKNKFKQSKLFLFWVK